MGLDMYLSAERFLWGGGYDHPDNEVSEKISAVMGGTPGRVRRVQCEIGYWRKANAIHAWFVKNCQGGVDECQETELCRGDLQQLLDVCKQVLAVARVVDGKIVNGQTLNRAGEWIDNLVDGKAIENAEEVAALLPTQDGFFFGGTGYNEWYLRDVEHTVEILEAALKIGPEWSISYRFSW